MHHSTTRTLRGTAICVLALAMGAGAAHAQDAAALRSATLAASCAACHGTAGRAVPRSTLPGLAGISADRFREAMKAFRSGERAGTVMPQLARGYDDAQIDRLAAFFAAQPEPR